VLAYTAIVSDESKRRHALVNFNLASREDVCTQLLNSLEFRKETLDELMKVVGLRGGSSKKEVLAANIGQVVARSANEARDKRIAIEFCKQTRQWLAFEPARLAKVPVVAGSATALLTEFGTSGWYGPFVDGSTHWLVYCHVTKHYVEIEQEGDKRTYRAFPARWHLVARITGDAVSVHWNNFSPNENKEDAEQERERQFPYWRFVPGILLQLKEMYGATSTAKEELHSFILHTLWERYPQSIQTAWHSLKVRALAEGVSVNAGGRKERDVSGVQKLTRSLALAAMRELGVDVNDAGLKKLDRALLQTILHEWGVKSYNFSVTTPDKRTFQAHCYFGTEEGSDTPDAFPHLLTLVGRGGSFAALDFLLREMSM
jgi:hypothetical protein